MTKAKESTSESKSPPYRLAQVAVKQFAEGDTEHLEDDFDEVGYEVGVAAELREADSLVIVGIQLRAFLTEGDREEGDELARLEAVYTYQVKNVEEFRSDEGSIMIPHMFLAMLIGIAISTSRGLLIGRTRYKELGRYPLPVISPAELLDNLLEGGNYDWVSTS